MNRVKDKVTVVTGGALGIGRATCLLLAAIPRAEPLRTVALPPSSTNPAREIDLNPVLFRTGSC